MISAGQLTGYGATAFVLIVIPGPSILFIVGRALAYGRATALATIVGLALGSYVVAVCVALGLGVLIERSDAAFTVVKIGGAIYLVALGIQTIRRSRRFEELGGSSSASRDGSHRLAPSVRQAVWQGVLVGLTNPKTLILFAAVLPEFVNRSAGHVQLQMLILPLLSLAIGLASDSAWAIAASAARQWLARTPHRLRLVGRGGGLAMIAVGMTVALAGREH